MAILYALKICSERNSRTSWCGNVSLERQKTKLLLVTISFWIPTVPPIIKSIVPKPFTEISLSLSENSSEVSCLPVKSRDIT